MAQDREAPLNANGVDIKEDEELQDLLHGELVLLQKKDGYRFSVDPILLTSFVDIRDADRVIDLGTGSGIIPLILAKRAGASGTAFVGVEVQEQMADMAGRSVAANQLGESIVIQRGDIRQIKENFAADSFDVVISNPPYVPLENGNVNPQDERAIARHEVLVNLVEVVQGARYLVKQRGRVYFVYPSSRLIDLLCLCRDNHLEPRRLQFVHANQESGAKLALVEAVCEAGVNLKVCKPMIVYNMEGDYTAEVAAILNERDLVD